MSPHGIEDISDENFDQNIGRASRPAVVDFWAPWCQPCKLVHPILERLAAKYGGQVNFFRMNVDEEKSKPAEYAIRSIPTLLFFRDGTIKNQMIGVQSEENIDKAVMDLL